MRLRCWIRLAISKFGLVVLFLCSATAGFSQTEAATVRGSVTDSTVADLIALLDEPDDSVRAFVAGALGNLHAKAAIPKLLALLPTADCLEGTLTSARPIRSALERMGVNPPAPSYNECYRPK